MAITTSQQIARYYEQFRGSDVTFTQEVIRTTLLYPKQVFVKCLGYQWACVLYSSSMQGARIVMSVNTPIRQVAAKAKNVVSLRYCFLQRDKPDPLAFFVNAKIDGIVPYGRKNSELNFIQLVFTQRPPDDLIDILGSLLDATASSQNRKEERVAVSADVVQKLGLLPKSVRLVVNNVPRKSILRDLSFSGARILIMGVPQFLVNKPAVLHLEFEDPQESVDLTGTIIRFEAVEGRNDVAAFALKFNEDRIPMTYKMRLNSIVRQKKAKKPGDAAVPSETA